MRAKIISIINSMFEVFFHGDVLRIHKFNYEFSFIKLQTILLLFKFN